MKTPEEILKKHGIEKDGTDAFFFERAVESMKEYEGSQTAIKTTITKESLLKFGMVENDHPGMPMSKELSSNGDGTVSIAVTRYFNVDQIALVIHGVGQLLLDVESIEDLEHIEKLVPSFDSFI